MRNDFIVFEFRNSDGSEVLLKPHALYQTAEALQATIESAFHLLNSNSNESGEVVIADGIEVLIGAVQRGSIKIGFFVKVANIHIHSEKNSKSTKLADGAAIATIILTAVTLWQLAGTHLDYFVPDAPSSQKLLEHEEVKNISANKGLRDGYEKLATSALECGSDTVFVSTPDGPVCAIVVDSSSPVHLGMDGQSPDLAFYGKVAGKLRIIAGPSEFDTDEGMRKYLVGQFDIDPIQTNLLRGGKEVPLPVVLKSATVLVEWQSKRVQPPMGEQIVVNGEAQRLNLSKVTATGPIAGEHRKVSAILVVQGMQVFE